MTTLFDRLDALRLSGAKISAALGMSRQAYSQARKRRRLSESAAMTAAPLLGISPAAALLINASAAASPDVPPEDPPAPINPPSPTPPEYANWDGLYYVKYDTHQCSDEKGGLASASWHCYSLQVHGRAFSRWPRIKRGEEANQDGTRR